MSDIQRFSNPTDVMRWSKPNTIDNHIKSNVPPVLRDQGGLPDIRVVIHITKMNRLRLGWKIVSYSQAVCSMIAVG